MSGQMQHRRAISPLDADAAEPPPSPAGGRSPLRFAAWALLIASLVLLVTLSVSAFLAWRWVDRNVLNWGTKDQPAETVNHAELLRRVRAFELATVKHTYDTQAHVEVNKVFDAGPSRVPVPAFIAGQELDVKAKVTVAAGVDLSGIRENDMEITRQGNETRVLIRVPAPEILSTEIVPNTLDMSTNSGLITRLRQRLGLNEQDLRDRAADEVVGVAKETAVREGILNEAAREAERRLQAFLQSLPQTGEERVTYIIVARDPITH